MTPLGTNPSEGSAHLAWRPLGLLWTWLPRRRAQGEVFSRGARSRPRKESTARIRSGRPCTRHGILGRSWASVPCPRRPSGGGRLDDGLSPHPLPCAQAEWPGVDFLRHLRARIRAEQHAYTSREGLTIARSCLCGRARTRAVDTRTETPAAEELVKKSRGKRFAESLRRHEAHRLPPVRRSPARAVQLCSKGGARETIRRGTVDLG